jgi:hypothetical protein
MEVLRNETHSMSDGASTVTTHTTGEDNESQLSSSANTAFSHTAWYTITSTGLLQSIRNRRNGGNAADGDSAKASGSGVAPGSPARRTRLTRGDSNLNNNNGNQQGLSYIYSLSSRGPREEVNVPQLRVSIKAAIV